jgi:hypothetical protein
VSHQAGDCRDTSSSAALLFRVGASGVERSLVGGHGVGRADATAMGAWRALQLPPSVVVLHRRRAGIPCHSCRRPTLLQETPETNRRPTYLRHRLARAGRQDWAAGRAASGPRSTEHVVGHRLAGAPTRARWGSSGVGEGTRRADQPAMAAARLPGVLHVFVHWQLAAVERFMLPVRSYCCPLLLAPSC